MAAYFGCRYIKAIAVDVEYHSALVISYIRNRVGCCVIASIVFYVIFDCADVRSPIGSIMVFSNAIA